MPSVPVSQREVNSRDQYCGSPSRWCGSGCDLSP